MDKLGETRMFKKTMIAALVLGTCGVANAGMYQTCKAGNATVPCEGSAWDFGADALYLNAREASVNSTNLTTPTSADWGWGFRIEGSYHFGTGNDFNINWARFKKTTTADLTIQGIPFGSRDWESSFDIVNFEFGQHIDFGERWDVRVHMGVQYAQVKEDISVNSNFSDSQSSGWGPRAGADVAYDVNNGFSVFGKASLSVLSAEQEQGITTAGGVTPATTRNQMVTVSEASLGVKYDKTMQQGDLTLRVGWETHSFINAFSQFNTSPGFDGIFFGAKWVG
jgi:hypothetical protein